MPDDPESSSTDAGRRFSSLLGRVLRVSKDELKRREEDYKKEREEIRKTTKHKRA